mmetsp:Transcript_23678/g.80077  ORF Transcript_23678/g.80077 Transcript_23678/m.80077 type:complete len:229 (-) Transcript_23678:44-730(-)
MSGCPGRPPGHGAPSRRLWRPGRRGGGRRSPCPCPDLGKLLRPFLSALWKWRRRHPRRRPRRRCRGSSRGGACRGRGRGQCARGRRGRASCPRALGLRPLVLLLLRPGLAGVAGRRGQEPLAERCHGSSSVLGSEKGGVLGRSGHHRDCLLRQGWTSRGLWPVSDRCRGSTPSSGGGGVLTRPLPNSSRVLVVSGALRETDACPLVFLRSENVPYPCPVGSACFGAIR